MKNKTITKIAVFQSKKIRKIEPPLFSIKTAGGVQKVSTMNNYLHLSQKGQIKRGKK